MELHQRITELDQLEIERKRKKEQLKMIEEKIHEIFDKEKRTVTIVQERQVRYVNPQVEELIGYSVEEVLGSSFAQYIHLDELPKVAKYYRERIAGADVPTIYTTVLKHKNGSDVPVEIKASVIQFQDKTADFAIIKKIDSPEK